MLVLIYLDLNISVVPVIYMIPLVAVVASPTEIQWDATRVVLDAPVNWTVAKVGDVLNIPMSHSGLTDQAYIKVYVRKACLELLTFLSRSSETVKMVTGCPGVGKSVEVFSYAMEQVHLSWFPSFSVCHLITHSFSISRSFLYDGTGSKQEQKRHLCTWK